MSSTTPTCDASKTPEVEMKTEDGEMSTSHSDKAAPSEERSSHDTDAKPKEDALLYTPLKRPSLLLTPNSNYHLSSSINMPFRRDQYNCKYWVNKGFCKTRRTTCKWRHDEERRNVWPWTGDQDEVFPDLVGQYSE